MASQVHVTEGGFVAALDTPPLPGAQLAPAAAMVAVTLIVLGLAAPLDLFQRSLSVLLGAAAVLAAVALWLRGVQRTTVFTFDGTLLAVEQVEQPPTRLGLGELVSATVVGRQLLLRRIDGWVLKVEVDREDPALAETHRLLEQVVALSVRRTDDIAARRARERVVDVSTGPKAP